MIRSVLSLFDGISCGRLALDRAGIKYEKYYASEIDKYAVAVARYNYPDTIFVGDVRYLKSEDFKDVDLLIGGSPCTDMSVAGHKKGMITKEKIEITTLDQYLELKEQGFEFEGQSYLFWEFVRLLKEVKPKWFLLENVRMAKKWRNVITNTLEIEPIEINSALVSAQQRKRLYWTNIPVKGLPEDKGILLRDILLPNTYTEREKSLCVMASYYKASGQDYFFKSMRQMVFNKPVKIGHIGKGRQGERVYNIDGKSVTLVANGGGWGAKTGLYLINNYIRKLHPIECERLQTLPDNYTQYGLFDDGQVKKISDTQRYKMIGNGWTVDVIAWIFGFLKNAKEPIKKPKMLSLF